MVWEKKRKKNKETKKKKGRKERRKSSKVTKCYKKYRRKTKSGNKALKDFPAKKRYISRLGWMRGRAKGKHRRAVKYGEMKILLKKPKHGEKRKT